MTQQYERANNITISTRDGGSVPIVSQTEINPMKTALSLMLALITTTALTEPLPVPKPPGPGGSCPHGDIASSSFCTPSLGAADAIAKRATALARGDGLRRAPTACEMAAPGSSFALASFSLVEGHAVPRGLPPRHPRIGSAEAGMSKRGHGRARGSSG